MALESWLSLALLCLLGAMTPGPSLAVVLGSMLRGGRGAGLAAALAHGLAVGLYAVLTVAGLATLLTASPTLFALLQFAAAGYLVFLASGALRQRAAMTPATDGSISHDRPGMAARDGFMIAFLNPKLAVFMLALFAPFITADQGLGAKALLVLTIGGIDALWYSTVVLVMVRSGLLSALARNAINVQRVYAALLLALALFVTSRAAGNWVLEKADPDGSEHRNATCQCTHDPIAGQFRLSSSETTYRRLQHAPATTTRHGCRRYLLLPEMRLSLRAPKRHPLPGRALPQLRRQAPARGLLS
ncbi:MAG: LysE family translocator [Halochromatium sp.]